MKSRHLRSSAVIKAAIFLTCSASYTIHTTGNVQAAPGIDLSQNPIVLSEAQMDLVSAGGAYVSVLALTETVGDSSYTATSTWASASSSPYAETAMGSAQAAACCGEDADARVFIVSGGSGDMVNALSGSITVSNSHYTRAQGWASVVVLNSPKLTSITLRRFIFPE